MAKIICPHVLGSRRYNLDPLGSHFKARAWGITWWLNRSRLKSGDDHRWVSLAKTSSNSFQEQVAEANLSCNILMYCYGHFEKLYLHQLHTINQVDMKMRDRGMLETKTNSFVKFRSWLCLLGFPLFSIKYWLRSLDIINICLRSGDPCMTKIWPPGSQCDDPRMRWPKTNVGRCAVFWGFPLTTTPKRSAFHPDATSLTKVEITRWNVTTIYFNTLGSWCTKCLIPSSLTTSSSPQLITQGIPT